MNENVNQGIKIDDLTQKLEKARTDNVLKDKMIFILTKAFIMQYKIQDLPCIGFNIHNKELENKINEVIEIVSQQAQQTEWEY